MQVPPYTDLDSSKPHTCVHIQMYVAMQQPLCILYMRINTIGIQLEHRRVGRV